MKRLTLPLIVTALFSGCAKPVDHPEIRGVLDGQIHAWNRGDLEGFMSGYWKSDEMLFSTPKSSTKGWQATLDRYRSHYPTGQAMGQLRFEELRISQSSPDIAEASGRYVQRTPEGLKTGRFFLNMKKLDSRWVIVHDHTTPDE